MSSYNDAVIEILKREGGFSNDVGDPGGATDFGISLRFLKEQGIDINHDGHFDIEDIKSLTEDTAKAIYKKCWWDTYKYYWVNNQELALKIFDFSVNAGPRASHQTAQKAINSLIEKPIAVDGVLGAQSCHYLNTLNQDKLLDAYKHYQKMFYQDLVNKHPALNKFLKGWLNRAEM